MSAKQRKRVNSFTVCVANHMTSLSKFSLIELWLKITNEIVQVLHRMRELRRLVPRSVYWHPSGRGWKDWRVSLRNMPKIFLSLTNICQIVRYVCPNCDPNSKLNYANLKTLNSQDQELIKKTFKSIQVSTRFNQHVYKPWLMTINIYRVIGTATPSRSQ